MSRILVIDDSADARSFLSQALSDSHQVACASDWLEANELIHGSKFELVIIDVNLPVVKGGAIANALKKAGHPARIALVSALPEDELGRLAREVGAAGYLPKPCSLASVKERVRAILALPSEVPER